VRDGGAAAAVTLAFASLPFVAAGRFGVPGVSVNNDPAFHLAWIDRVAAGSDPFGIVQDGYPLGPHALVAAIGELTGDLESTFVGLLLTVPVLTALSALGGLNELSPARRVVAGTLTGLAYLAAANLAQAAFKEPMVALFLIGSAVVLREAGAGRLRLGPAAAGLVLLTAGSVATFSWPGAAWPASATAIFLVLRPQTLAVLRRVGGRRVLLWGAAGLAALAALVVAAAALDVLGGDDVVDVYYGGYPGGNLTGPVPFYESLGVWFQSDFRVPTTWGGAALKLALLVTAAYAALQWARHGDWAVPAGVAAGLAVYAVTRVVAEDYPTFKALGVVAPVMMLMIAGGLLLAAPSPRDLRSRAEGRAWAWARAAVAVAFVAAAAWSSGLALRGAIVRDESHADALAELRPLVRGQPTLFLGKDDWAVWDLRRADLAEVVPYGVPRPQPRRRKPLRRPGTPADFDSVVPQALDAFRFAVTTHTAYASTPPANWRRIKTTGDYVLWERRGPTPPRALLPEERDAPGVLLDCRSGFGRRVARGPGAVLVRPAPVLGDPAAWRLPSGGLRPAYAPDTLEEGQTVSQALRLPPGRWEISLQYLGSMSLQVRAGERSVTLPPNQELPGPWWRVAEVEGGRDVPVTITADRMPRLEVRRTAAVGNVAAVRLGAPARWVSPPRACGLYVDGYAPAFPR
jgi:hypothetical protein